MTKNIHASVPAVFPDFSGEIIALIRSRLAPKAMQAQLCAYHEKDLALALPLLSREEQQQLFRLLPPRTMAGVLEYAPCAVSYFSQLRIRQQTEVLTHMETAAASELLQQLPWQAQTALLELLEPEIRRELCLIHSFDPEEIGSRMSTNFIAIPDSATVKMAMSQLVAQAADHDNISTLYLTDGAGTFCGAMTLKDLIIAREDTPLSAITMASYPYLYAHAAIADCIHFISEYSEEAIPVLDDENRLIGVVTAQDFIELLDDAMGDDYAKLAGLASEEDLAEPVMTSVRKRMPWLAILLLLGLGVSATVGLFEGIVAQLPVILCFQSLILDMAGNVGTQSLAVAIRVLMDTQLGRRHRAALVWKEVRIGLLNGLVLGTLSVLVVGGYLCLIGNAPGFSFAVAGCLGAAMLLAMIISALSGTVIPIFFQRLGIDPAVASGPLITTINDLVAVITYYGLAWLILLQMLHLA